MNAKCLYICFLCRRGTHFSMFFGNNSSSMRRTQISMTGSLIRSTRRIHWTHSNFGRSSLGDGNAFMFSRFFVIIFLRSPADQNFPLWNALNCNLGGFRQSETGPVDYDQLPRLRQQTRTSYAVHNCNSAVSILVFFNQYDIDMIFCKISSISIRYDTIFWKKLVRYITGDSKAIYLWKPQQAGYGRFQMMASTSVHVTGLWPISCEMWRHTTFAVVLCMQISFVSL